MRSILMWMALVGMAATAEAQTPTPTIEEVEAQIAAAEAKQAEAAEAARAAQALRATEAARKAEVQRQARVKRDAVNAELERQARVKRDAQAKRNRFEKVAEGVRDNAQNLIWAASDNGSDIDWNDASSYCASKGAGWTLPTVAALQSLYDASGKYPQSLTFYGSTFTIKPASTLISLSGSAFWSNEQNGASEAWSVGMFAGVRDAAPVGNYGRALCVRRS